MIDLKEISNLENLCGFIRNRQSVVVDGLPGMGKTVLLKKLLRADVQEDYLSEDMVLMRYVDLNSLPKVESGFVYRKIARELGVEDTEDLFALSEAIRNYLLGVTEKHLMVLVFDHFENTRNLSEDFFNQLASWRQEFSGRLLYVVAVTNVVKLLEVQHMGALAGAFKSNYYYVKPYGDVEMEGLVADMVLSGTLEKKDLEKLVGLAYGHPGLAKVLVEWWRSGGLEFGNLSETVIARQPNVRFVLEDILGYLSDTEKEAFRRLCLGDREVVGIDYLEKIQLVAHRRPVIAYFVDYFAELQNVGSQTILITGGRVFIDGKELVLTAQEFEVFGYLFNHKGEIVGREELTKVLAPESEGDGVSNEVIDQYISRLRKKLSVLGGEVIKTVHGRGYLIAI